MNALTASMWSVTSPSHAIVEKNHRMVNEGGVAAYTSSKSRPATWLYPHPTNRVLIFRMLPSAFTRTSNTHLDFITGTPSGRGTAVQAWFPIFPKISSSIRALKIGHHWEAIASSTVLIAPMPDASAAVCARSVGAVTVTSTVWLVCRATSGDEVSRASSVSDWLSLMSATVPALNFDTPSRSSPRTPSAMYEALATSVASTASAPFTGEASEPRTDARRRRGTLATVSGLIRMSPPSSR